MASHLQLHTFWGTVRRALLGRDYLIVQAPTKTCLQSEPHKKVSETCAPNNIEKRIAFWGRAAYSNKKRFFFYNPNRHCFFKPCASDPSRDFHLLQRNENGVMVWECYALSTLHVVLVVAAALKQTCCHGLLRYHLLAHCDDKLDIVWISQHNNCFSHSLQNAKTGLKCISLEQCHDAAAL